MAELAVSSCNQGIAYQYFAALCLMPSGLSMQMVHTFEALSFNNEIMARIVFLS